MTVKTDSGIPVKRVYTKRDTRLETDLPGKYPFTRGIHPSMYRKRLWTMREYAGFGTPQETNKRFKYLVSKGQTGLSVAFDLPTQLGYDSDHPRAEGEVGRVGVPISSVRDMEELFRGIEVEKVSTSMTINATSMIIFAAYLLNAENKGASFLNLRGTVQNDILKEYAARNTYIFPPAQSMKLAVDIIEYCIKKVPKWYPISVSGYHIREAGANAVQEVAFAVANGIEYVKHAVDRGLKADEVLPRISFFFVSRNDFFEEIAKFRAARRVWARIVKEKFHTKKKDSAKLRFHVQTSGETLTAVQTEVNVPRVTLQALAAVLGGAQSIHTNSYDEALSLPTEESVRLALRTQQVIAYESGVTRTVDPLGGSYLLESQTETVESRAIELLEKIEKMGGALKAIEDGFMQKSIRENAYRYQKMVEDGEVKVVGGNIFAEDGDGKTKIAIHRLDPGSIERRVKELKAFKENRDHGKVSAALERLGESLDSEVNLLPNVMEYLRAGATLGEISATFREVYGEFRPQTFF